MFSISVFPSDVASGSDGERLGEIVIGAFRERFAAYWRQEENPSAIETEWTASLQQLIDGKLAVALRTDPRLAWVLYREGRKVYLQQQLTITRRDRDDNFWMLDGTTRPEGVDDMTEQRCVDWVSFMCDVAQSHGCVFSTWSLTDPSTLDSWSNENIDVDPEVERK